MSNQKIWDAARCQRERAAAIQLQEREIRIHNQAWNIACDTDEETIQRLLNESTGVNSFNERMYYVALDIKKNYLTPPESIRCEGCLFNYPNGHPSQKYHMGIDGCLNQVVHHPTVRKKN